MPLVPRFFALLLPALLLAACASPEPYRYQYIPGRTATMMGDYAVPPPAAPPAVMAAIAAGNRITGTPYAYGGGHRGEFAAAYDCSGAASYVLRAAGLMHGSTTSRGFRHFDDSGPGDWISIYARKNHVFLVIAGLRFDTGYLGRDSARGPHWTTRTRPADGCVIRHPQGY